MLVVHSSPLAEPGSGDAGGMTVYVRQVARALAARGVEVDIYTRRDSEGTPAETLLYPSVRVIQVNAGRPGITKEELPPILPEFTSGLLQSIGESGRSYDLIHSHYWLSGRVASILSNRLRIPFVHTFHTLGRVKNDGRPPEEAVESDGRLDGETKVIADADAIVASTPLEREWLIDLYAAHPERIHLIPPGVDHELFTPGDRVAAKRSLGMDRKRVLLFVGRLQPLKAADTAIRSLAHLIEWHRISTDGIRLVIVGGASGEMGAEEPARLLGLAQELGVSSSITFVPAQPQARLPLFYRAADVCLVPSYSESFGLVALEAQSCGIPVVGSAVGGLRTIVRHGQTGYLVEPSSSAAFAERAWRILSDQPLAEAMSNLAVCSSSEYSWQRSAVELYDLYALTRSDSEMTSKWKDAKKLDGSRRKVSPRS